jgi:hypothetical protein
MKRLKIENFDNRVTDITSDYFDIRYGTDMKDKYVLGISGKNHYKMAIYKEDGDEAYGYTVWLWDMGKNISYPMSVDTMDLSNSSAFGEYLSKVIRLADKGEFNGHSGNRITLNQ